MTLDPRISFWFSLIAALVSGLLAAGAEFTDIFGADTGKKILAVLAIVNTMVNALNAALHMIPSKNTPEDSNKFLLGPAAAQPASAGARPA
jgi:hypothetical protein